jgi:predicted DNA binding CopG/RHH family protein
MKRPERYNKRTINGLDARDMIKELNLNFNEGNILKYLLRDKNQDIQDLEKIINYAQHEIEYLKKQNPQPERNENGVIEAVVW